MRIFFLLVLLTLPAVVSAAEPRPTDFKGLVNSFLRIIGLLLPLLFGLSLIVFLWGIANAWIIGGGDEKAVDKGKKIALAGIIGLVVMSGVWGIVAFVKISLF